MNVPEGTKKIPQLKHNGTRPSKKQDNDFRDKHHQKRKTSTENKKTFLVKNNVICQN